MSRSKHIQHGGAKQWNPPELEKSGNAMMRNQSVASATECTGLEIRPAMDDEAALSYTQLYGIHRQKAQGDIEKRE